MGDVQVVAAERGDTAESFEAFLRRHGDPSKLSPPMREILRLFYEAGGSADAARILAIEGMGPNGTIRIDDESGLAPRYIHWGGSTGLTLREAIDAAVIRSR